MPIPNRADYELLIYNLPEKYSAQIQTSTLRLYSTSALTARVEGEIYFRNGLTLKIREFVDFRTNRILDYSYTVYREETKIRWYDPQPHPEDPSLAATFPHHYHEEPNIKRNRKLASGISFNAPNLSTLIVDSEELGKKNTNRV